MVTQSTLKHLRIPFSFFLMPVYWFALSVSPDIDIAHAVLAFLALHLLIYPASNGFNSYYDKDESSIGGLEKPPPVSADLLMTSLFFDAVGVVIALFAGWQFALALIIYGLISKAYSHPAIRLKKYPVISLLATTIFQGGFIFLAVYQTVNRCGIEELLQPRVLYGGLLNTLMLIGSYPMTQVYQHEEDARRGDLTMSRLLGIKGTFLYTALCFSATIAGFVFYYQTFHTLQHGLFFMAALFPVLVFFLYWFARVYYDVKQADYKNTMRLNLLSSLCLNVFFIGAMIMMHS